MISCVESLLEQLLHRAPCLVNIEAQQLKCGPESITPDGKYILGRVPEVRIYSDDARCFLLIFPTFSLHLCHQCLCQNALGQNLGGFF